MHLCAKHALFAVIGNGSMFSISIAHRREGRAANRQTWHYAKLHEGCLHCYEKTALEHVKHRWSAQRDKKRMRLEIKKARRPGWWNQVKTGVKWVKESVDLVDHLVRFVSVGEAVWGNLNETRSIIGPTRARLTCSDKEIKTYLFLLLITV